MPTLEFAMTPLPVLSPFSPSLLSSSQLAAPAAACSVLPDLLRQPLAHAKHLAKLVRECGASSWWSSRLPGWGREESI